ncbi:GNAT family N-acetyltransferase [Tuberibacillus sp. Marseille-P3662]|uniref:GNAT family N-acetyltransferase n=1 Tax=Tuberibacillus sp. Marseille-P3662 TaxID=1965358 RepID=UPI000A1CAD8E|nr:GNAT family N-acetyltransferase [Tuberibacillus sp. Marseille-P3662]
MKTKLADRSDAALIHDLMIKAFVEYNDAEPPSSALEETVESIATALKDDEQSLISYVDGEAVGMVRFRLKENAVYFYRLSVIPEKQGQGIAKKILRSLEDYAKQNSIPTMLCKVRMNVSKNIKLYSSMGYSIYDEEVINKPNGTSIKVVSMVKQL